MPRAIESPNSQEGTYNQVVKYLSMSALCTDRRRLYLGGGSKERPGHITYARNHDVPSLLNNPCVCVCGARACCSVHNSVSITLPLSCPLSPSPRRICVSYLQRQIERKTILQRSSPRYQQYKKCTAGHITVICFNFLSSHSLLKQGSYTSLKRGKCSMARSRPHLGFPNVRLNVRRVLLQLYVGTTAHICPIYSPINHQISK